ncbi:hypothetical protein cypCar_00037858 [Cyprinus carpio]|nr:hypothetical protein cypCar_00037858 [Cyprinus carpio]
MWTPLIVTKSKQVTNMKVSVSRPHHLSLECSLFSRFPELRSPPHIGGLNRSVSLSYTDHSEPQSISSTQPPYTPDFNVRALADLQFVKITRSQYQHGLMVSRLDSSPQCLDGAHGPADDSTTSALHPSSEHTDEMTSLLNEQNSRTQHT